MPTTVLPALSKQTYPLPPEEARAFYHSGGRVGVLLIHGFTSTPYVFRELGRKLASANYTVSAPLLVGHGTSPEDLESTTWEEWCASAEKALSQLEQTCDEVFILGASFGGNIACYLAAQKEHRIEGLILIGMPRWLHRYKHFLVNLGMYAYGVIGKRYFNKSIYKNGDSSSLIGGPTYSYYQIPTKSVRQLFPLMTKVTDQALVSITCPTIIIQSTNDGLVDTHSGHYIYQKINSSHKQLIWINEPHSELHTSESRINTYHSIIDFITRWQKAG